MTLPSGQPVFGDFIAFWSAGRAALDGHAAQVHDRGADLAVSPSRRAGRAYRRAVEFAADVSADRVALLALLPYPVAAIGVSGRSRRCLSLRRARSFLPDARALISRRRCRRRSIISARCRPGMLIAGVSGLALALARQAAAARRARWSGCSRSSRIWRCCGRCCLRFPDVGARLPRRRSSTAAVRRARGLRCSASTPMRASSTISAPRKRLISEQRITTPAYASLYANLLGLGAPHSARDWPRKRSAPLRRLSSPASDLSRAAIAHVGGAALCAATLLDLALSLLLRFHAACGRRGVARRAARRFELCAAIFAWGAGLIAGCRRLSSAAAALPARGVACARRRVQARKKRGASSRRQHHSRKRAAEAGAGVDVDAARLADPARNRAVGVWPWTTQDDRRARRDRANGRELKNLCERVHIRSSSLQSGNVLGSMPPCTNTRPRASSRIITGSVRSQAMCIVDRSRRGNRRCTPLARMYDTMVSSPPFSAHQ